MRDIDPADVLRCLLVAKPIRARLSAKSPLFRYNCNPLVIVMRRAKCLLQQHGPPYNSVTTELSSGASGEDNDDAIF
jgi:hypothetical protein